MVNAMRVLISTNIVPPYRVSLFEAIGRGLQTIGGQLAVVAWAPDMEGRNWKTEADALPFECQYVSGSSLGSHAKVPRDVFPKLARILKDADADVVLSTGFGGASLLGAAVARARRIPFLLWSEATGGSRDHDDSRLRLIERRALGRASRGVVVPGIAAERYARKFHKTTVRLRNTIDLGTFKLGRSKEGRPYVLTVGQLRGYRNHNLLIEPIRRAVREGYYDYWVLVGDGPDSTSLLGECRRGLGDRFVHHSYASQDQISELLSGATCFASVPSRDIWGFAVQEAVMCGVPVLISPAVGCGADLVRPGSGGYITRTMPNKSLDFEEDVFIGLVSAATEESQRRSMEAASSLRREWTPEMSAERFIAELSEAVRTGV
jgi:glycosyltransferase involved in cell wall biosynthesis